MTDKAMPEIFSATWPRFSRYEVRNDCLCPAMDAGYEFYDPWRLYDEARAERGDREAPHQAFLNLWQSVPGRPQEGVAPRVGQATSIDRDASADVLCHWASTFGLLGLLLGRLRRVVLVPRWAQPQGCPSGGLLPVQEIHSYSLGSWSTELKTYDWRDLAELGRSSGEACLGKSVSLELFEQAVEGRTALDSAGVGSKQMETLAPSEWWPPGNPRMDYWAQFKRAEPKPARPLTRRTWAPPSPVPTKDELIAILKAEFDTEMMGPTPKRPREFGWPDQWSSGPETTGAKLMDWETPHALVYKGGRVERASLSEEMSRYFPDVPPGERETFPYPRPMSEEFWRSYGEPVQEVVAVLADLRALAEALVAARVPVGAGVEADYQDRLAEYERYGMESLAATIKGTRSTMRKEAAERLQMYMANSYQRFGLAEGGVFRQRWVTASLLESLALMMARDLVEENGPLRRCRGCGRIFMTRSYQQLSCSDRCTWNYHKRRQRADERFLNHEGPLAARRLAAEGFNVRQIHAQLQSRAGFKLSLARVRDWLADGE